MPGRPARPPSGRTLRVLAAAVAIGLVGIGSAAFLLASGRPASTATASVEPSNEAVDDLPGSIPPFASAPPHVVPSGDPVIGPTAWRVPFLWHVPVLMYHLVATPQEAGDALPGLVVAPDRFRAELAALQAAGWTTITAGTLARDMAAGTEPPPRTLVITLDDGHQDGFTEAFPILRSFGFVATYYVPTRRIDHAGYLSRDQLVQLATAGMEIANHTQDHVPLARVSPLEVRVEVDGAQAILAEILGAPPLTLAYPYGSQDLQAATLVDQAGIAVAFTTVEGCSESPSDRLVEPRVRVRPATTPEGLLSQLDRCATLPAWG